jgi:hypothetical protein
MKWKTDCRFSLMSLMVTTFAACAMLTPNVLQRREDRIVLFSDTSRDYLISTLSDYGWPLTFRSEEVITDIHYDFALKLDALRDRSVNPFERLSVLFAEHGPSSDRPVSAIYPNCVVLSLDEFSRYFPEPELRRGIQERLGQKFGIDPPYQGSAHKWYVGGLIADLTLALAAVICCAAFTEVLVRRSCRCPQPVPPGPSAQEADEAG